MPHDTNEFPTRRASLAAVGSALLLLLAGAVHAEAQPAGQDITKQDIFKALGGRTQAEQDLLDKLGGLTVRKLTTSAPSKEEQTIKEILDREPRSLKVEDRGMVADKARDKPSINLEINFDFDSAVLKSTSLAFELGQALLDPQFRGVVFLVGGHTDAKGGDAYNLDLSQRRADAIKAFLVQRVGVPAANLRPIGFGKEKLKNSTNPFADENRRVQVVRMLERE